MAFPSRPFAILLALVLNTDHCLQASILTIVSLFVPSILEEEREEDDLGATDPGFWAFAVTFFFVGIAVLDFDIALLDDRVPTIVLLCCYS